MRDDSAAIAKYYDNSVFAYRLFAHNTQTLSIHYGLREPGVKDRHEAMLRENDFVITLAAIERGMRVLDAGCGVGGSALYIAENTGAHVTGLTLSPRQVMLAKQYAATRGLSDRTSFFVTDYTKTNFPNNSFDVIYGIESICYAVPKSAFLQEALRLLKPGGRLVVSDGYVTHRPQTPQEQNILKQFLFGYSLQELITFEEMGKAMKKAGFKKTYYVSKTAEVEPAVKYFGILASLLLPFLYVIKRIHTSLLALYKNGIAVKAAYDGMKIGFAEYGVWVGRKNSAYKHDASYLQIV